MKPTQIGPLECLINPKSTKSCIVLFHGYGADSSDLAPISQISTPSDLTWIFPNGIQKLDMGRAWGQIDPEMMGKNMDTYRPPGIEESYQTVRAFLDELESQYCEILLGGFSQGAMLATELTLRAAKKPKALIIWSGILISKDLWSQWAPTGQGIKFFQSHGYYDPLLDFQQAEALFQILTQHQWKGEFHSFPGQHEIPSNILNSFKHFLSSIL